VSHVLLWQPSDCVHSFVIDCVVLFSESKYDDDDDDITVARFHGTARGGQVRSNVSR